MIPLLTSRAWKTSYRHGEDDLVETFYVPALSSAVRYDRMTGYFTADALALAARGIERLIENDGTLRLVVGCTLEQDEVHAVEKGYELREELEKHLAGVDLTPPDLRAREGLEALAWLIANERLDVRVAVPADREGKPTTAPGIYHEKVGVITDPGENRLAFSGSINETRGGWLSNRESFHVHCSWEGGREAHHVEDEVRAFEKLWNGDAQSVLVVDFPDAVRQKLLQFLPTDDRFVSPPPKVKGEDETEAGLEEEGSEELAPAKLYPDEIRRVVWAYIRHAARLSNDVRVGEVTSAVVPWPHQIRAYKRLLDSWPCQMLIADEVGLGKTITTGLFIRQAWLAGLAKRVLVLVPRAVLAQWQSELYEKFNLSVPVYDGKRLSWKATHAQPIRVTTRAAVFEDHADSHEFLSPGGDIFERLSPDHDGAAETADGEPREAYLWLRETPEGRREIVACTRRGNRVIGSLTELLEVLGELRRGRLDGAGSGLGGQPLA